MYIIEFWKHPSFLDNNNKTQHMVDLKKKLLVTTESPRQQVCWITIINWDFSQRKRTQMNVRCSSQGVSNECLLCHSPSHTGLWSFEAQEIPSVMVTLQSVKVQSTLRVIVACRVLRYNWHQVSPSSCCLLRLCVTVVTWKDYMVTSTWVSELLPEIPSVWNLVLCQGRWLYLRTVTTAPLELHFWVLWSLGVHCENLQCWNSLKNHLMLSSSPKDDNSYMCSMFQIKKKNLSFSITPSCANWFIVIILS
jgi:hypothetical protein